MYCKSPSKISFILLILIMLMASILMQVKAITWSVNTKQLTINSYIHYDGYPALTQISNGSVWLVWAKEIDPDLTLYYKTTNDLGRTWSNEKNLTTMLAPGHNQNPSIIQAQNSTIWVAWTSDRPPPPPPPIPDFHLDASPQNLTIPQGESNNSTIIVTSTNNFNETVDLMVFSEPTGVTTAFDPTQVVPPPNGTANSTLTISVSPTATTGNYTITVIGRSDHLMHSVDIYLEISVAGGTSQASADIRTLSPLSVLSPETDYEIYYKTSHDNGATWSRDLLLTDNDVDDLCPAIIQLTNGTIMIFWQTYISGSFNIVYKTTTDGTSWSNTTQLTTDSAHDKGPAATQTMDGRIWVAWASRRTGDYEIFYKIYDGVSWLNATRLTNSTNSDVNPAILQTVKEEILIFWASMPDQLDAVHDIYYKSSADNGSSWSGSIEFAASNYDDMWPATIQTHETKIWVAWASNRGDQPNGNWDIYLETSLAGDVNEDNVVDAVDLTIVSLSYGAFEGAPEYNPDADINNDGIVDLQDLAIVAHYLGET